VEFRFGVDLITFYDPGFWGFTSREMLEERAAKDPRWFWGQIAETVASVGITGVELTFPPGDWQTAARTYGSGGAFAGVMGESGISVISGFFDGLEVSKDLEDEATQRKVIDDAKRYSAFLREAGASILVSGMPMRRRGTPEQPVFVDFGYAKKLSDFINRLGAAVLTEGVRLALHPEVGSVFCVRRDIDLFMLLTDPAYVDMCPDTAHIFLGGVSPVDVLHDHAERVTIAHWKDAVGRWPNDDQANQDRFELEALYFKRVGSGSVDWAGWLRGLNIAQFDGWTILELDAAADPVPDMTAAREFVENLADQG
jgi:sugar phosphate isomerase/epimerase